MLTRAPAGLGGWIQAIGDADIPVLARTAQAIDAMREDEDDVAPRAIAEVVLEDPLMSLKVLAHVARHRSARMTTETETVTAALLMMGVSTFFRTFAGQQTVEARLGPIPGAMAGLEHVLRRAHRAGRFAIAFAMARNDTDAEVIQEAALLHDFAEALLWLPELLQHLTNDRLSNVPRVRNVLLATALARHSQHGWDNAALPDDVEAIGRLLNLAPPAVWSLIRELDETAAEAVPAAD